MELKYRGREQAATIIKAGLSAAMAGTALGLAPPAFAQQASEGTTVLQQIVVTASGFEQNVKDAPASITVVTREDLEKGSYRDLTDALREVQGVSVTGIANEKDVFIRGLPGAYTLILVDGKRQSTRDARTNGNSGFEQSFVPPVSAIERIEVVRGPMSSLYGSDAMGGVINIITRKVGDVWSGSVTTEGTVQQHSKFGNSGQVSWYANGPILKDQLGLQVWGRGFTRGEDGILNGTTGAKEYDFNGRLTFTPNEDHDIYLEGGKTRLRRDAEPGETLARNSDGTYNTNTRDHWSLSHTGRWGPTTSEFSFQQEWAERTNFTRNIRTGRVTENPRSPEVRNTVLDGKFTTPFELFGNHTLVTGGQYFEARLTDQNPGRRTGRDETFSATQWALFLEDEWRIVDNFALTGGLRLDNHEKYGNHFSPRLYGVWSATEELTIKGGISTGFRAPEIRQIAPGYAYTTGGGGCTYGPSGTCGVIIGDPNLEAEKSTSYEVAALWDNGDVALGATYFYTDFKDKISNALVLNPDGTPARWSEDRNYRLWYNYNIDDAVIQGVELTATWYATPELTLRGNYTYTHSEQKTGDYEGFPLARTPEHMANLRGDWVTPIDGLEAWASLNYHGSEINAGPRIGTNGTPVTINGKAGRKYDAYATLDIGAKYAVAENVDLNAAIYNVFDKDVGTDDFNTVMEGRRFWISMTAKF
ncbi:MULTISPECIES: TonB-dependent siderophore receptor [unclassified Agrobacterium]|uniref:TonB-dependent siderophore receptor n=1 Tax=unclassified Agrobacterium TaxID=2632611 RepID=UPI002446ED07|nr:MULTISPECIES: TonB-dependent siderophore receptor [unclassified Agrobacterium]MDH0611842.1 TonB-dependent siderophore receptor [Agrobacterium sp. GD03872]MDH0695739.1 TonB-dependent siderophore receptor [Agrobacterium sp. GD03871]MDH1058987.1 TonB-dependent siderophore receptor [Agrobacterium sp. GD03992]MDH2211078.1 TonB-dependent siderophore receptor [Agrobacterium sp. GD03643]MDH2222635.1 TonB-dependent siderophore receptor [Agrobacterium sp. GD03638]